MTKKLNLLFLAAILIFLFLGVNAAFAYTLSGIIYGGSNPMPNATVNLYDASTGNQLQSTVTNTSGFYSFTVDNGTYNLLIVPPSESGYEDAVVNGIPVNGADVTQNVVLILRVFSLSGVVRGVSGATVSNICLDIKDQASGTKVGSAKTNVSGNYSIAVPGGTYKIDVYGGKFSSCIGDPNSPAPEEFTIRPIISNLTISANTVQDFNLPFVTLSGKTTDSNGSPVGNVLLKGFYASWNQDGVNYYPNPAINTG